MIKNSVIEIIYHSCFRKCGSYLPFKNFALVPFLSVIDLLFLKFSMFARLNASDMYIVHCVSEKNTQFLFLL